MANASKPDWDDSILPFQLDASSIRGRVARLDGVLDKVLSQHDYPDMIEGLVAETAILTALIGEAIKLRWKLSIQVRGDGPVRLIATDYYAPQSDAEPAQIRAYASFDADRLDPNADPFSQIGKGYFAILIDQGQDMTPYQGITPIAGTGLSQCAETYFAQSEQLPTRFSTAFGKSQMPGQPENWRAGGVMIQTMPTDDIRPEPKEDRRDDALLTAADILSGEAEENWARTNILLDTVEELELVGPSVSPSDLLLRLFHEEKPRVFDPKMVAFGCTCSEERVRDSLSIYSAKDIAVMTKDGLVEADCQFCGSHYELDPNTVGFEADGGSET